MKIFTFGLFYSLLFLFSCNNFKSLKETSKVSEDDPFKSEIVESQFISVSAKEDNIVEGNNGTIITIPKGAFINASGEVIEDSVMIELAEAYDLDEMILSNLTTTSNGEALETGGMVFFNVTSNGEQLKVNPDNPVYIEVPTSDKKPGMMAYAGERDKNGNMNWVDPKPLENYLITVDLDLLDFLPPGFENKVIEGLPFHGYEIATREFVDSLYYSLSVVDPNVLTQGFQNSNLTEAYYNRDRIVLNGKYTDKSYEGSSLAGDTSYRGISNLCGIDPAVIKTIKSKEYQNTFIATREFEKRMKEIHLSNSQQILDIYLKNLSRNLWETDSIAASQIENYKSEWRCYDTDMELKQTFNDFASEKLTNVKDASKYSELLKGFYEKKYDEIKKELNAALKKMEAELKQQNKMAEQTVTEYREVLWKREKSRMETYGFTWTNTGWINIDRGTIPKTWGPKKLEVEVDNAVEMDRTYTYIVYTSIQSIYRLNSDDSEPTKFYVGNEYEKEMLMPKKQPALIVSVGYKNEDLFIATDEIETGSVEKAKLNLEHSDKNQLDKILAPFSSYKDENLVSTDLDYQAKLYTEKMRQQKLMKEQVYITGLWIFVYNSCCSYAVER